MASVETVAVLFTDLVDSTELASRVGPERAEQLRLEHFRLLRDAIAASHGREIKNLGDGLMVVFPSAAGAVECAASMQQRVEYRNRAADEAFEVRIGVAMGDASRDDGDYFGPPVVEAARLCATAVGSQVLITDVTRVMVGGRGGHRFSAVGALELKGLSEPVPAHELLWESLPGTARSSGDTADRTDELPPLPLHPNEPIPPLDEERFADLGAQMRAAVSSERFVGRERELAALEAQSGAVLIGGDAGVGKSRLVSELERRAKDEGRLVLVGECFELTEGELPYGPIVDALRPVLRARELLDSLTPFERTELARLWPEVAPADGGVQGDGASSSQGRIFALLLQLLTRLGDERPVVFIVEDLHWADRSTRDFLAFLVRAARGARVLVVATLREEDVHRDHPLRSFVAELARVRGVRRLQLAPFTREELTLQVEAILGERPSADLVEHLFERTEGNAFYTEELLAAGPRTELPQSLRDVLLVRIERLSAPARRLLAVASAAGRAVDERLLAAVGELPQGVFEGALREALAHQVLVRQGDGGSYGFRHALVREAVYRDLLAAERSELHAALARTLVQRPELAATGIGIAAELAHHWYAAGDAIRAFAASVSASEVAERAFAFAETHRHSERAMLLWERVPEPTRAVGIDRATLLMRAAGAAVRADNPGRAAELAQQASREVDGVRDPLRLARIHMLVGRASWLRGDIDRALAAYRTAVELVPPEPPSAERALVVAGEGQALMLTGRSRQALARCEEALKLADVVGDRLVQAHVHNTLCGLGWLAGDPVAHAASAREIAVDIGAVEEIGRSYANGSEALDYAGRVEEAVGLAEEGIATAPRWGIHDFIVYLTVNIAGWQLRLGNLAEAERICAEVTPRGHTAAAPWHRILGELATARGDFSRAQAELESADQLARGIGGPEWWPIVLAALGKVQLWQARLDDATGTLHAALDAVDDLEYVPWLPDFADVYPTAARVHADRAEDARAGDTDPSGEVAAAHGAHIALEKMLAASPREQRPPRAVACSLLAAAEVTRARGQSDATAWQAVADRFRAMNEPYTVAYAEFRQAQAMHAGVGPFEAIAWLLEDAHAITVRLGERPLRTEIDRLRHRILPHTGDCS